MRGTAHASLGREPRGHAGRVLDGEPAGPCEDAGTALGPRGWVFHAAASCPGQEKWRARTGKASDMRRPGRGEALTAPWAGHGASRRQTRTRTRTAATRQPARPLPGAQSPLRHRHRRGLRGGHTPGTAFWSARGPRTLPAHTAGARARGEGGPQGLPCARGDVAESGAEELLDSGEACNPVRLSGSFNVRFHTAPEGAILDEASRMFFEHPSRDAFGSKDTAHSPRGCRCAACSNWRERVPSSTAGRTSSLNGTAEVSRARTLLSGRNPRRSPKQWPGEHTSGPGDGAWLTCVRVRAGARFLGCCGPRLACSCDGKCARPQGQRTRVHWKRPRLWHPPPGPLDTEAHGT